jgi:hypothetical protein
MTPEAQRWMDKQRERAVLDRINQPSIWAQLPDRSTPRMNILDLLKRIQITGGHGEKYCPECDEWPHTEKCELKAAIEELETRAARIDRMEPELKAFFNPTEHEGMK